VQRAQKDDRDGDEDRVREVDVLVSNGRGTLMRDMSASPMVRP
jgi:hypothetical protein